MVSRRAAIVLGVVLIACTGPRSGALRPANLPAPDEPASGDLSNLVPSLHGPSRIVYDPQALGPPGRFVSIHLENTSKRVVSLSHVHATFTATRDDVSFPCNAHVGDNAGAIEPRNLKPGQSATIERLLDCAMPLPGHYDVRVWIHSDREEGGGPPCRVFGGSYTEDEGCRPGADVYVGSLQVDVVAAGTAPQPVAARQGLFAVIVGPTVTPPIPAEAWAEGRYRVALVLVNGTDRPLPVGPSRLSLLVFREGSASPPCGGEDQPLDVPNVLAPGAVQILLVPVTCAPAEEGRYRIVGRLAIGDEEGSEIGELRLLVTKDPYLRFEPIGPEPAVPPRHPR
jgi:hypothetical protein